MYLQLLNHIGKYIQLNQQEESLLCEKLQYKLLKKRDYLIKPGKLCTGEYFVLKGCVRQYYLNGKSKEQIIQFALENWWIADHESLMTKLPAHTHIQATENTELAFLTQEDRAILVEQIPKLETYFLIIMRKAFVASQRRIGFIFSLTEEERYRQFAKLFPDFLQRVPQYMLASYLGFTPQFFKPAKGQKK